MRGEPTGRLVPEADRRGHEARGVRQAGPTQCHGLSGNIEFLLDLYQATGDPAYRAEARSLGQLLEGLATEHQGLLV